MRSLLVAAATASLAVSLSACNCNVSPTLDDGGTGGGSAAGGGSSGGGSATGGSGTGGSSVGGGSAGGGSAGGGSAGGGSAGGGSAGGGSAGGGSAGGGSAMGGGSGGGMASCTADQSCYPFASGTPGVGACRSGTASCTNGTLGPCTGAVGPSPEACNGIDDDCNGQVDDGLGMTSCGVGICANTVSTCVGGMAQTCKPGAPQQEQCNNNLDDDCDGIVNNGCGCIHVAPNGNDSNTGNAANPVRHLNIALDIAADAGVSSICVASGAACPSTFEYGGSATDGGEVLVMRNGISVLGGFHSGAWAQAAGCVTRLTSEQTALGVVFDHNITSPTELSSFELVGGDFPNAAAVTVRGSTGAIINLDNITGGSGTSVQNSIGVDVVDVGGIAATPLIERSSITGAPVAADGGVSIGVRSFNSAPNITGNCNSFDNAGRCNGGCGNNTSNPPVLSIRGVTGGIGGTTPVVTSIAIGVLLDTSPKAVVDSSAVCSIAGAVTNTTSAAVRIQGDAQAVIVRTSNLISFGGGKDSVGVWAAPCGGRAPWVFNNFNIGGTSGTVGSRSDGIRAVGDCHPVIDSNLVITGGVEQAGQDTNGVYCALDPATGIASRCTVLANLAIRGSNNGFPPRSIGVRCDDGACARIEGNPIITGRGGNLSAGILVSRAGPYIGRNGIFGGCGRVQSIGLGVNDAFPRVENNLIEGMVGNNTMAVCASPGGVPADAYAVMVLNANGKNEIDLHSNTLFGTDALQTVACTSRALVFDVSDGGTPTAPLGLVRNNVLAAGACPTRYDVQELNAAADPRVLQNNWFDSTLANGIVLYRDEATTDLLDAGAINALTDITSSNNIEGACGVTPAAFHLAATSVCRNAGTDAGAPSQDIDKDSRPQEGVFDIGADEYVP
jgi:hypothetical protein